MVSDVLNLLTVVIGLLVAGSIKDKITEK